MKVCNSGDRHYLSLTQPGLLIRSSKASEITGPLSSFLEKCCQPHTLSHTAPPRLSQPSFLSYFFQKSPADTVGSPALPDPTVPIKPALESLYLRHVLIGSEEFAPFKDKIHHFGAAGSFLQFEISLCCEGQWMPGRTLQL